MVDIDFDKPINEIVLTENDYNKDRNALFDAVAKQINILLSSGYICTVRAEESSVIIIDFEHDENIDPWGAPNPIWLTEEEISSYYELVKNYKENNNG